MNNSKMETKKEKVKELPQGFIFDEKKLFVKKPFTFFEKDGIAGVGLILQKDEIKEIKKDKKTFTVLSRIDKPLIIFSNGNSEEVNSGFERKYGIQFYSIPNVMKKRWGLNSIKEFLTNKNLKKINKKELFEEVVLKYEKYSFFSNEMWYKIHALWDLGTYFTQLFNAYPIFEQRGSRGTAKTKNMRISSNMSFNATEIMTNPSEATLFRETHDKRPTKYFDEAENLFRMEKGKPVSDDRVLVINSSYDKSGTVPRQEKKGNKYYTEWYSTYSPTMVSSINGLFGATEDRAIVHICIRAPSEDKRGELEPSDEEFIDIRNKLHIFQLQNWREIKEIYEKYKNITKLRNRDFQIWKPILSLSKFIDEELHNQIIEFSEKVVSRKDATISDSSVTHKLLKICFELINESGKVYTSSIRERYEYEYGEKYLPSNNKISRELNNLGLDEFKEHWNDGNGWRINKIDFERLISPICPFLFSNNTSNASDTSLSSSNNKNNNNNNEVLVKQSELITSKKGEAFEAFEANEDYTDTKKFLKKGAKCHICQDEAIRISDNGKPVCDYCSKVIRINSGGNEK